MSDTKTDLLPQSSEPLTEELKKTAPTVPLPDNIHWDSERNAIVGNFEPVLAVRVLREYLHPAAVAARQDFRKQNRALYWQELSDTERTTMIDWDECTYCRECTWCLARSRLTLNTLINRQCEHCFYLREVTIPFS